MTSAGALAPFLGIRAEWSSNRCPNEEPWRLGGILSDAMDDALAALAGSGSSGAVDLAVVAVGGYGRRELCLHSDIDVMLLHRGDLPPEIPKRVLYPLWDSGLKIGHSVRTVREATTAARDNLETLCNLLTARLVVGERLLIDDLEEELSRLMRRERARLPAVLAEEERSCREGEPFFSQEPDVKSGRGGLRSFHRLDWERARQALTGSRPPPGIDAEETEARRVLVSVRAALHAVQGRAAERYAHDLRASVSEWLGSDSVAGEVYRALRVGDRRAWECLGEGRTIESDPVAAAGRRVMAALRGRWGRPQAGGAASPPLRAAVGAARGRRSLTTLEAAGVRSWASPRWTEPDRTALLTLLASGVDGFEAVRRLDELGWVRRFLPELGRLTALPQRAPFHDHPVDGHSWRTVTELATISDPQGPEPWCAELAEELGSLDEALLAGALHDLGKGLGPGHAQGGGAIAQDLLLRLGFDPPVVETVVKAVRHHLLVPIAATERDVDDPDVIEDVAEQVGDLHSLRLLTLLSVADSRATGPTMWSPWRASLFQRLYERVAARLGSTAHPLEEAAFSSVVTELPDLDVAAIRAHVEGMPDGYLLRFGPDTVASHLRLVLPPPARGEVRLDAASGAPISSVVVATLDRPGLLAAIAGAFALHNVSVLEARVATRHDGVCVDTFLVIDALGQETIGKARWPAIRADLRAALAGDLPLEARLVEKAREYRQSAGEGVAEVEVIPEGGLTTIRVRCPDRVGLLHGLALAMAELGLDIHLAKVDTRGREALDTFRVGDPRSEHPGRDGEVRSALMRVLRPDRA